MASDPFTQVYDAMVAEFKAENLKIIDWNSSRDPEPISPTDAELPELQLRPAGMTGEIGNSSCGSIINRSYQLLINSGDQRAAVLFGVEWRILKVLQRLKYGSLDNIVENNVSIDSSQAGLSNSEENRGIKGWTALWNISVQMMFSGADL